MSSIKPENVVEQSFVLLIKCMLQSKHRLIELGSEYDLTAMQTMLMLMLDTPRPMNSFTKLLNCDASNITGIVDGLEQKDLASRFAGIDDRRIKMVKLSPKGLSLKAKLFQRLSEHGSTALSKLSAPELETFTALLTKINVSDF